MRFPYFQLSPKYFAPIVPIKILGKDGWIDFEAYIDSGASYSIFKSDRAEILGLDYKKGQEFFLTVGDGGILKVYIHRLKVELANKNFVAHVGFSNQLGIAFNLLGRKSFFENFQICFNDAGRFVDLQVI